MSNIFADQQITVTKAEEKTVLNYLNTKKLTFHIISMAIYHTDYRLHCVALTSLSDTPQQQSTLAALTLQLNQFVLFLKCLLRTDFLILEEDIFTTFSCFEMNIKLARTLKP